MHRIRAKRSLVIHPRTDPVDPVFEFRNRVCVLFLIFVTMANLALLVPVLLLALFIREGSPVRCWSCSSDLNQLCADPFVANRYDNSYLLQLSNCDANTGATYPYLTSSKSVCKKQKKYINGQLVISRGCTWKRSDDYSNQCPSTSNGPNEVTSYCETCDYDGCNGAAAIGKTIALLLAPMALLLFK